MKRKMKFIGLWAMALFIFASCAAPQQEKEIDMDQLKEQIQAMEDAFAAAELAKDADGVVEYYADDAVSYSRNRPPVVGKEAIKQRIAENIEKDSSGSYSVYKVVDLFADGDVAVEIGSWTNYDSSGTELRNGHYMSYFEKRDGKYVCVRDMSASTTPDKPKKAAEDSSEDSSEEAE